MIKEIDILYWNSIKMQLKLNYPQLTDADLFWRNGSNEDMIKIIAVKLGKTKKELEEAIERY